MSLEKMDFEQPAGDPGWFGPDSVIWKVHGDAGSMLAGGSRALLLQMLHPLALAGVWDHSNFRGDMYGRLQRTSQFVTATTFASTKIADQLVERVKKIHLHINGVDKNGPPYSASDPKLLTWVHVAECSSFMAAYLRYHRHRLSGAQQDQYYREASKVAIALGAREVPVSRAEVSDYFQQMRPQLRCDDRTRDIARVLFQLTSPSLVIRPMIPLMLKAGVDLLPDWASEMLELTQSPLQRRMVRAGARTLAAAIRCSMQNGPYRCSMRRMGR